MVQSQRVTFFPKNFKINETVQQHFINRPTHMISCLFKFLSFRLTFQVLEVYLQTIPRKYMKTSKFAFSICYVFFSSFTINSLNYICVILKLIYYSSDPTHAFLVPNNECSCVRVCFFLLFYFVPTSSCLVECSSQSSCSLPQENAVNIFKNNTRTLGSIYFVVQSLECIVIGKWFGLLVISL